MQNGQDKQQLREGQEEEEEEEEDDDEEEESELSAQSDESDDEEDIEEDEEYNTYKHGKSSDRDTLATECINKVAIVLTKTRTIARLSKKSSLIHSKVKSLVKRAGIKRGNTFLSDFRIRWNSSVIMLKRMQKMKQIAKELSSAIIEGLTKPQQAKLKANDLSNNEWETISTLVSILKPFFETTKILSGKYPTLSLSFLVYKFLKSFLNSLMINNDENSLEYILSETLLEKLEYHFNTKLSKSQLMLRLVSYFSKYLLSIFYFII